MQWRSLTYLSHPPSLTSPLRRPKSTFSRLLKINSDEAKGQADLLFPGGTYVQTHLSISLWFSVFVFDRAACP